MIFKGKHILYECVSLPLPVRHQMDFQDVESNSRRNPVCVRVAEHNHQRGKVGL